MTDTSEEFINSSLDSLPTLTFEYCSRSGHYGLLFYYSVATVCFFLGTPAQLWFLWFYFCAEQKIKVTQVFLLNHTIMEIIYSLECGIETLNMFVFNNDILWSVLYFMFGLSWVGRPLLQICICVEQYLAVVHPVTFLRYKAVKYRSAAAAAAWLVAFAYGGYVIYAMIFPDYLYTFVFIIALAVISFCCVSVMCALKHPGPGDTHIAMQTGKDRGNRQKRNAFNTIFSALLLIIFTYLPQAILIFFTGTGVGQLLFTCTIVYFLTSLNIFGVTITPFPKLYKEIHLKKNLKESKEINITA